MKKIYTKVSAFFGLCIASIPLCAQLSGVYTINSGAGTSGTNFQTFTAFAAAINAQGVSGPVTVNVVANTGPYNEQVAFTSASGVSAANKVTIEGNNNLITFNASSGAPWTISLNSADWMVIKKPES